MEYIASDIGYVKVLHGVGLVGSAIFLAIPLAFIVQAVLRWHRHPALATAVILVTVSVLALHAKELGLMTRNHWSVHAFLFCVMVRVTARREFIGGRGA